MADEANIPNPATAAPAAEASQAPSLDSPPAAAPAAASSDAPAPAGSEAAPAAGGPEPTLLEKFDAGAEPPTADKPAEPAEKPAEAAKPDDAKPADAKPEEKAAEKPAEAKPAEKPAEKAAEPAKLEPVAYEYEVPATIKMDDGLKTEFHAVLDGFRADPAKGAQGLIALHEKAMTDYAQQLQDNQMKVWNETRKAWRNEVMSDEQIGGSGYQTAMSTVAKMRDLFVPEAERKSFDDFLKTTGAGDHPAFLKMLHRAGQHFEEAPMPPRDIKPAPDNGKNPNSRRGALLYDHPRSPQNRQ